MRIFKLLFLILITASCQSEYTQLKQEEISSGEKFDSLFLGLEFGMKSADFYKQAFQLNKEGIVRQGNANTTVFFRIDHLNEAINVDFFPDFKEDKIARMRVIAEYNGWAPWNKRLSADSLATDFVTLIEGWYAGNEFIEMKKTGLNQAYVKIDGNRRIVISPKTDSQVQIVYDDLHNEITD